MWYFMLHLYGVCVVVHVDLPNSSTLIVCLIGSLMTGGVRSFDAMFVHHFFEQIFVGGLDQEVNDADFRAYFAS